MNYHDWQQVQRLANGQWKYILGTLAGLSAKQLSDQHQPCPACGGHDRYRFDDNDGQGTYYCNGCGAGAGLDLLIKVTAMPFPEAVNAVGDLLGNDPADRQPMRRLPIAPPKKSAPRKLERIQNKERAKAWLNQAEPTPITVYCANRFAAPAGLLATETGTAIVPIHRHGDLVNAAAVAEDGRIAYAAGAMTYGGHTAIPGDGRSVFITVDWIDAMHVARATGCTCIATWTVDNFADVAIEYDGDKPLIAAVNNTQDDIALASGAALDCILPDGDDLIYRARKMKRKLYNPFDLLER